MTNGSINKVKLALATDPWSADLTLGVARYYVMIGDPILASHYLHRFKQTAPNSPLAQGLP